MEVNRGKGPYDCGVADLLCDGSSPYGLFKHRNSFALVEEIRLRVDLGGWPDLRIGREPVSP